MFFMNTVTIIKIHKYVNVKPFLPLLIAFSHGTMPVVNLKYFSKKGSRFIVEKGRTFAVNMPMLSKMITDH